MSAALQGSEFDDVALRRRANPITQALSYGKHDTIQQGKEKDSGDESGKERLRQKQRSAHTLVHPTSILQHLIDHSKIRIESLSGGILH
jgi:hypothetical protein